MIVADDSPIHRLLLERQLERLGCDVVLCETGREALEEWMHRRPNLLLSDLYMPGWADWTRCGQFDEPKTGRRGNGGRAQPRFWLVPPHFLDLRGSDRSRF